MTNSATAVAETVWDRFQAVGFTPDLGPEESRLLIALYRRLAADGSPISASEVDKLADHAGIESEVAWALIEKMSERDEEGAIRGIMGLSLNRHPHKFLVHGHELATWCALDPLVIAPTMTDSIKLESDDPRSGEPVRVSVSPGAVMTFEPDTAVVSIVIPKSGSPDNVEAVWKMFCHQVYFFTSRESGELFFSGRNLEIYYLPIEEAFRLGSLIFGPVHSQL